MKKERYYSYLSGEIRLKTGADEEYPLSGYILMAKGSVIEEGKDGRVHMTLDPFIDIDKIFFIPDPLLRTKEILNICVKNLPEYLCGRVKSNLYSLNEGEDEPSKESKIKGEISYELYLQLKRWDSEAGHFIGKIVTRDKFEEHLNTGTLYNIKYNIEDLTFVYWSSYGAGSPHEWCREAVEKGLELIEWHGHPMGDCIFMLFKHNNKKLPPFPKGDPMGDGEVIYHKVRDEQSIRDCFPEYIKN